ncbi:MAG: tetraacyldisaccharide 4'-kinase [Myxococcota bacterium]|nr:tetraacyldisaccharide 4'-kinase [Myxococcota bacterium]
MNEHVAGAPFEGARREGRAAGNVSGLWVRAASRHLVRSLRVPAGVRVICIGGATLGGSGKTPLAVACAAEIAASGRHVVLVGHAYRGRPRGARLVTEADALHEVGDEALLAARALAGLHLDGRARVVVAPHREEAVALAARYADILVIDGVAQTKPTPSTLALLAVDASEPWGRSARMPPCGNLRAPVAALLSVSDAVVAVGDPGMGSQVPGALQAHVLSEGVRIGATRLNWADLRGARLGLIAALARPERVVRALARRGVTLHAVLAARDHGPLSPRLLERARGMPVDLWLATAKCALHIEAHGGTVLNPLLPCAPLVSSARWAVPFNRVATIDYALALSRGLKERLRATAVS